MQMKTFHVLKFNTYWGALLNEAFLCSSEHWDTICYVPGAHTQFRKKKKQHYLEVFHIFCVG